MWQPGNPVHVNNLCSVVFTVTQDQTRRGCEENGHWSTLKVRPGSTTPQELSGQISFFNVDVTKEACFKKVAVE